MPFDTRAWWVDLLWGGNLCQESPIEHIQWQFSVRAGTLSLKLSRIRCWFTGHKTTCGEHWNYEPNYCPKCFTDWPSEHTTLPVLFSRSYCWLVEQDWEWFNWLDESLLRYVPLRWWPSWWEY